MSDLIDRQEAIEHCKKRLLESAYNNVQVVCDVSYTMQEIADNRIENWLKELPSVQPETRRWIPFSERLPEPYAHVILTIRGTDMIKVEEGETLEEALKRNNQQYWVTIGYLADDGWNGGDGFPLIVKPIAWTEFPEPWKGEEK